MQGGKTMQTLRARVEGKRLNTIIRLPETFLNKTLEIDVYLDEETPKKTKSDGESFVSINEISIGNRISLDNSGDLTARRYSLKERLAMLDSLAGIVPPDIDENKIKYERLARQ
jgi:hypothetical protein